ncbi:septum formation inhibitor Maf [Rhodoferax sp. 4810]|uniref:7-methyl-GTP pyrophosphatase n=1 Tax=Thiospirillum jenense TaxID=1653858 RepID=A0A839HCG8_9GAMM|nr:Maf family nucleotide pyrophosphatase [Thiospirillum jenense]MBB1073964.1 septum formation inhibitor Maf [Rhodoferax jenense]MBB1125840.1 septum formation inhibitor Maf [Thiospirillum jenense]
MTKSPPLILASTSPYRRDLLTRLRLPFTTIAPQVDEQPLPNELPHALVQRLSIAKARAVAAQYPTALIIGSDQVACLDGQIIGKPGEREAAIAQLTQASGRMVEFLTGLCLMNAAMGESQYYCESSRVYFRASSTADIIAYVDREQPFNCAGSIQSEGLGIALFERLESDDPTALIGLPLIRLVSFLQAAGYNLFDAD